jgi:hypothetical protein
VTKVEILPKKDVKNKCNRSQSVKIIHKMISLRHRFIFSQKAHVRSMTTNVSFVKSLLKFFLFKVICEYQTIPHTVGENENTSYFISDTNISNIVSSNVLLRASEKPFCTGKSSIERCSKT